MKYTCMCELTFYFDKIDKKIFKTNLDYWEYGMNMWNMCMWYKLPMAQLSTKDQIGKYKDVKVTDSLQQWAKLIP